MSLRQASHFSLILAGMTLFGCEGDPGMQGQNRLPDDRYPPTVEIILPLAGKPVYDRAVVEAIMLDDDSLSHYEFLVDGLSANQYFSLRRAPSLFTWDASTLPPGRHTLQLRAWDAAGKVGESSLLYLMRSDQVDPGRDTLRYYTDSTRMVATEWKLPADSAGSFAGLGVRFTPDRPCLLKFVGIKIHRRSAWAGTKLYLDVYSESGGLPDTLRYRKPFELRPPVEGSNEYNDWTVINLRTGVLFESEFFAIVTLAEDADGDTLAIQSDDGGWANGHGLVKTLSGEWQTFNIGRGRKPNPLIYAVVAY